jgi:hypothetical protein
MSSGAQLLVTGFAVTRPGPSHSMRLPVSSSLSLWSNSVLNSTFFTWGTKIVSFFRLPNSTFIKRLFLLDHSFSFVFHASALVKTI